MLHRGQPAERQDALQRGQGGRRPVRARLHADLSRHGHRDDSLREQLRPLPVSGETGAIDDHQRAARQESAGLRRRAADARLAARLGSLRGDLDDPPRAARGGGIRGRHPARAAADLRRLGAQRAHQHGDRRARSLPARQAPRRLDRARPGPPESRPALPDRSGQAGARARLEAARRLRSGNRRDREVVRRSPLLVGGDSGPHRRPRLRLGGRHRRPGAKGRPPTRRKCRQ